MKIIKIILIIVAFLVIVLFLIAVWLGFFTNIQIKERQEGDFILVGKEYKGSYSSVYKPMQEIDNKLRVQGIFCEKGFGIYYDDPKKVAEDQCRSFVGNILNEKDYVKIVELKQAGFKVDTITKKQSLVIDFPIKNKMSYFIGPMKVYPAFNKLIEEKKYKPTLIMELYDIPNKKILFIMQFDK